MSRLRIRVELSRTGVGVPLHKLNSVTGELNKFLNLLAEDVHVEKQRGEWLVFDFDRENLNFTAEYVGAVAGHQVEAFNSAFDGATSLRRDTIAQFLKITDAIGDDEVIGFGLYTSDDTQEPSEWRCLSRRDALRMGDEVQLLSSSAQESHLPAVSDPGLGARMFGGRHERNLELTRVTDHVREVETGLANRMQRLENRVDQHAQQIQDFGAQAKATETSFRNLLTTVETFCEQATQRIETISPPAALPPAAVAYGDTRRQWIVAGGAVVTIAALLLAWSTVKPGDEAAPLAAVKPAAEATPPAPPVPEPAPVAVAPPPAPAARTAAATFTSPMQVELEATADTWISMKDAAGNPILSQLLAKGTTRGITLDRGAILRVGNAGGLTIRAAGKVLAPVGPIGGVLDVEFKDGGVTVVPLRP